MFRGPPQSYGCPAYKGILLEGGPMLDDSGRLAMILVEDEAQARKIVAEDPAVEEGVFTAKLHLWLQVDWAGHGGSGVKRVKRGTGILILSLRESEPDCPIVWLK